MSDKPEFLPVLGAGIGFRPQFKTELFLNQSKVNFLEIVAEHYLGVSTEKQQELELLSEHFTLIPHALNLSLGSAEGLDLDYLKKLTNLINRLNSPWWSEHISFTSAGGIDIGHLSPLPFTHEAVDVIVKNVETIRSFTQIPLILENITYMFTIPGSEMTEAEFITAVLEKTGCGMLLDITNLYTNSVNHGYDPYQFLKEIPLDQVVQLHFVGGHWSHGLLIDSHSHPTPPEIWSLMETVISSGKVKAMILERDDNFPDFSELIAELAQAQLIFAKGCNSGFKTDRISKT